MIDVYVKAGTSHKSSHSIYLAYHINIRPLRRLIEFSRPSFCCLGNYFIRINCFPYFILGANSLSIRRRIFAITNISHLPMKFLIIEILFPCFIEISITPRKSLGINLVFIADAPKMFFYSRAFYAAPIGYKTFG